ncbi:MAG: hypothetical protein ABI334_08670 [Candidatus Dormiibacterota bacterium]
MDKSPILPAEHDPNCRRTGAGGLDIEHCERCSNLSARLDQWRGTGIYQGLASDPMEPKAEGQA